MMRVALHARVSCCDDVEFRNGHKDLERRQVAAHMLEETHWDHRAEIARSRHMRQDQEARNQLRILGSWMGSMDELQFGLVLVRGGRIRAALSWMLPLKAAHEAHRVLADRAISGKLALLPWAADKSRGEDSRAGVVAVDGEFAREDGPRQDSA